MIAYYLAYGSNLSEHNLRACCPNAKLKGTVILENYGLYFRGSCNNYSYLTIEKQTGSYVPAAIFEIPTGEIDTLDKYENYPNLYRKKFLDIKLNNSTLRVMVYVIRPEYEYYLPSVEYITVCANGYQNFSFDKQVLIDAIINTKNKITKQRS